MANQCPLNDEEIGIPDHLSVPLCPCNRQPAERLTYAGEKIDLDSAPASLIENWIDA